MIDCTKCARRGQVNGLSQESYCSSCIHGTPWKKDHYSEHPSGTYAHKQCDGCARSLRIVDGLHRDDDEKPVQACTSHLYC